VNTEQYALIGCIQLHGYYCTLFFNPMKAFSSNCSDPFPKCLKISVLVQQRISLQHYNPILPFLNTVHFKQILHVVLPPVQIENKLKYEPNKPNNPNHTPDQGRYPETPFNPIPAGAASIPPQSRANIGIQAPDVSTRHVPRK
jgi:hypothetical protein